MKNDTTVPCSLKRLSVIIALSIALGCVMGCVVGAFVIAPAADEGIDYSTLYTSEVVADFGIYRFVPNTPYTYGSDYYRDNTKTHKAEHGGKPSFYCKACIDYYLDMGGYVLSRDGNIVYYTGVDLRDLQLMQGGNRNFTVMRDPRLFTYGSDIFDPPLVTAQDGGGTVADGVRIFGSIYSAYLVPQQRQEILCSALDNMILSNESCFLGIYTYRATNWTSQGMDQFVILAFYGDSTGSYVLAEEGTVDDHITYRLKTSSGSHSVRVYTLNSNGWFYSSSVNLNATGVLLGTLQTGYSFGLQYCYPLVANSAPTSAVAVMTGDQTLPAQRSTVSFSYPRFTSVSSATRTSGTLVGVDSAITSKVAWLAIRHVYNLAKVNTGGSSSDYIYTESEYLAYGQQQKQVGIDTVTQNPRAYSLRTEAEFTEYGQTQKAAGRTEGINLVKANPSEYGIDAGDVTVEQVVLPVAGIIDTVVASPYRMFLQWLNPLDEVLGISVGGLVSVVVVLCILLGAWSIIKRIWTR